MQVRGVQSLLFNPVPAVGLAVFRVVFGLAMVISTLRFLCLGWVEEQYLRPVFHFTYAGFDWVNVLPAWGMYGLYVLLLLASVGIMLGLFYRFSALTFFLAFTYVELIDKTYYLNHYYFVSLVAFLLCLMPAHRFFSLDIRRKPSLLLRTVPAWTVYLLKFQLACVYFFAGIAKVNPSWLLEAMPLRIWLPANDGMPFIGSFFCQTLVAFIFSWVGMVYDLSIPFLLYWRKSRLPSYLVLLIFHGMTGYFFQIGVFPLVMSLCTLIFFSAQGHRNQLKLISGILRPFKRWKKITSGHIEPIPINIWQRRVAIVFVFSYVTIQTLLPFRYLLYPGDLFWTEEGFRFSWRVMLVEKAGSAFFRIRNNQNGEEFDVINRQFLNVHQEKQMAFQPDMILQYAHYLGAYYQKLGMKDISVYCDCYVTMNGQPSRLMVDPKTNLLEEKETLLPKKWLLSYQ